MKFGLSEKEAKIYLALLELEVATVNEISKVTDINRSSTYVVLDSLQKRGLVSVSAGKKIQSYIVAPPDRLARLADEAAKKQADVRQKINNILPDLKSLYKGTRKKPVVRIYEGKKSTISLLEDTLDMHEKVLRVYTSASNMPLFMQRYMPQYMKKRNEKGIKMLAIHPDDLKNRLLKKFQPKNDESVFISPNKYKFSSQFAVYDNKIGYISKSNKLSIIIEDQEIAGAMKSAFDLAFEGAKILKSNR